MGCGRSSAQDDHSKGRILRGGSHSSARGIDSKGGDFRCARFWGPRSHTPLPGDLRIAQWTKRGHASCYHKLRKKATLITKRLFECRFRMGLRKPGFEWRVAKASVSNGRIA